MQLDPKHYTLHELLNGRLFKIPEYQRAYAWGQKQRNDLFKDILEIQETGNDHFMATVVCLARDKKNIRAISFRGVEIVDGQQRLTTLIILLKAIEKKLDSKDAEIKKQIENLLIKGDDFSLVLLQTNHQTSTAFVDYLRLGKISKMEFPTDAEQNLVDAARECELFVADWQKKYNSLEDLVSILFNNISMIYHELEDEASVYRIFEVLNSRGLDVKWIDKLKSQLMALIFAHAESGARANALREMQTKWQQIYVTLGLRSELGDDALQFAGTWKSDAVPKRLLSEQDAAAKLTASGGAKLKTIGEVGDWIKKVVGALDRLDRDVKLRAVTRIKHPRFVATAILLLGLPKKNEERLLKHWERVTFRIFGLLGEDSRFKIGDYVQLGYEILNRNLSENGICKRLDELGKDQPIDEVLKKVEWWDCYNDWDEELRYFMYKYDEYLAPKGKINQSQWNKIWLSDSSKSIEHILPQSTKVDYVHHLGNLTMLPPDVNSGLGAKKPRKKSAM